jgi:hypothetical protein
MNFEAALTALKASKQVYRQGSWDPAVTWVFMVGNDTITSAFIAMHEADGLITPWVPTTNDLLASNWSVK